MQKQAEPEGKVRIPEPPEDEIQSFLDKLAVGRQSNLIGVLQQVQARFGYLPACALRRISQRTRVPLSRIYGVLSFYAQFYTAPRGKHTVRCCRGTACHVRGGKRVIQVAQSILGLDEGETSADMMFSFETIACLGACALSPVVVMDGTYYGKMTPQRIEAILKRMVAAESARKETG